MTPEEEQSLKERERKRFMKFFFAAKDGRLSKKEVFLTVKGLEKEIIFEETREMLKTLYKKLEEL